MSTSWKLPRGQAGGYAALAITSIFWGTTWVASKIGVRDVPALQLAAIRQLIAGAILVSYFFFVKKQPWPNKRQWGMLVILSMLMFVMANGLSTWSLQYIPTGFSALVGALYPLSVVIIERIFFGARALSLITYVGLLLGIGGVALVFYPNLVGEHPPGFWGGMALSVSAMLAWSAGTMIIARKSNGLNPYYGLGWQMLISSAILYGGMVITEQEIPLQQFTPAAWWSIAYLVLAGSLLSFAAFVYSMKYLPPAISSLYAYLNPLVAMLTAYWVLGEPLTWNIGIGALITLSGVFLVNFSILRVSRRQDDTL